MIETIQIKPFEECVGYLWPHSIAQFYWPVIFQKIPTNISTTETIKINEIFLFLFSARK